ncbi:MAG: hypothetical protein WC603_01215 [Candidatus Paceibacterota bacterium]|jgi:hypothetical protein
MKKIKKIIFDVEKKFPKEFENIILCTKSNSHDWIIRQPFKQFNIRLMDIECKNCRINLTIAMRFFAGIQDHG